MKKILKTRKALQSFAAMLALATTISGCSFRGNVDTLPEETTAYESIDETHDHDFIDEEDLIDETEVSVSDEKEEDKSESNVLEEDEKNSDKENNVSQKEDLAKEESIGTAISTDIGTPIEANVDLTAESFIVMFEGAELVVPNLSMQYNSGAYTKFSINQALKKAGFDNSFAYRAKLAQFYGIKNYRGTSSQNILLLNYLRHPELYLDMTSVIVDEEEKTEQQEKENTNGQDQGNGNGQGQGQGNGQGNGNGNGNGGGNGGGSGEEDKHEHKYGSLIVEYSNINDNTHTVTSYRVCNGCGKKDIVSTKNETHSYTWTTQGNKDIGKCSCGHTIERTHEHNHGDWKKVDEVYVALDNGKHRVDIIEQCQVLVDGKPCTYTRTIKGSEVECTYGADGKCQCGNVKKQEHVHGDWKKVDEIYVPLDDGKHRVDVIEQCQISIDGKECTETRTITGSEVSCTYGANGQCQCGNVKNHEHGQWKEIRTEVVPSVDGLHHRVDSIQQCQVLVDGKLCTYTRTVKGSEVDCNWTLNDNTECQCGNKHTHNMTYSYLNNSEEQGVCDVCGKTTTRSHPATSIVETATDEYTYTGPDGHKYKITIHCDSCNHDLDYKNSDLMPHDKVSTGKSDVQYDAVGHWYNETFGCADCGYDMGTIKVDEKEHSKDTQVNYVPVEGTAEGVFEHTVTTYVVCTDGCGWTAENTVVESCDNLGSECSKCHQQTKVHQHSTVEGEAVEVHEADACKRVPIYCSDSSCENHAVPIEYKDIPHDPKIVDNDNPIRDPNGSGQIVVKVVCNTCGDILEYVPYVPTSNTPAEGEEPGDGFDFDLTSYSLEEKTEGVELQEVAAGEGDGEKNTELQAEAAVEGEGEGKDSEGIEEIEEIEEVEEIEEIAELEEDLAEEYQKVVTELTEGYEKQSEEVQEQGKALTLGQQ